MFSSDVMSEINARVFESELATDYSELQPKEAIDGIRLLAPVVVSVGEVKLKGLEVPEMLSFVLPAALLGRKDHRDSVAVAINPTSPVVALTIRPATQFNVAQIREIATLCVRLEMMTADRVLRRPSDETDAPIFFNADTSVLLPPNLDMADAELETILYSLLVRIENAESVLRAKSAVQLPPLDTMTALVSALRGLDERTLEEVWSTLHRT
jgi:adenylate cyclase